MSFLYTCPLFTLGSSSQGIEKHVFDEIGLVRFRAAVMIESDVVGEYELATSAARTPCSALLFTDNL